MDIKLVPILLTVLLLKEGDCSCDGQKDLFNVTARASWYQYNIRQKVTHSITLRQNFYLLKNFTGIDVIEANVPHLCENMIIDFPHLQTLYLVGVKLTKIEPGAFQNVSRLEWLSLAVNDLTHIPEGAFDNLPSLEKLYLSANRISSIGEKAFHNLPNLRAIHLDRNKLTYINGNLFSKCPLIDLLDYNFNSIQRIPSNALDGIQPSHQKPISILLNKNNINEVDALNLASLQDNPLNLYLKDNKITTLSDVFFSLTEKSNLYLNKNGITCIPDDVLEAMKDTTKNLYLNENPIICECVERIENVLQMAEGPGKLIYSTTVADRLICATYVDA